jgi:Domain of unknown function (DUF4350)
MSTPAQPPPPATPATSWAGAEPSPDQAGSRPSTPDPAAGPDPAADPARAGSSIDVTPRQIWRAARVPLAVLAGVLLLAGIMGYVNSRERDGLLDPRVAKPAGSKALAELLRAQGVTVDLVHTAREAAQTGPDTTLLVLFPELLQEEQLRELAGGDARRLVLVGPTPEALDALAPGLVLREVVDVEDREPACSLRAARRAGVAEVGGVLVEAVGNARATLCYATGGRAAVASVQTPRRTVVTVGAPDALTNDRLDEEGNAALALNLLGEQPRLRWYLPSLADAAGAGTESPFDLLPSGWKWGTLQVGIAMLLVALWRMRRLGPVVAEPLPVVVRGAETVEGRARLYRRAKARDRAAEVLREASRGRLARLVGQAGSGGPHALVDALAARVGWPADHVGWLLYGSVPVDDAALVRLADDLDALEGEVRRS